MTTLDTTKTRTVRGDGLELAVYETGDADAPTVVLVHGYPDDHTVWDGVVEHLRDRYHVVTYDVRGAGRSGVPTDREGYALSRLSADLEAVIDATSRGRPVHLVGHDWGSIQSWEAVTDPRFASRLASFTSISGPCLDHVGHWARKMVTKGALASFASQAIRSWYIYAFQLPFVPELAWRRGLADAWPKMLARTERTRVEASPTMADDAARGVELYRQNMPARLASPRDRYTDVPVQVIVPRGDRFVATEPFEDLARWASRAFFRVVDGAHWFVRKDPKRVARYIAEMIEHVEGTANPPLLLRARLPKTKPDQGRFVVITGGGSGIGRATALAFAQRGADILIADVNLEGAEATARLCRDFGATATAEKLDVRDREAMERFAARVEREHGAPDVVVNNAGIGVAGKFLDTPPEEWERVLDVNVWGVLHGCRLFGAQMVARGEGGHIVNLASAAAFTPSVNLPAYATSKSAVLMLSECLRGELAPHGIGVSAICPGIIDTPITRNTTFTGVSTEEQERRREATAKLYGKRGLGPEAVATAIVRAVERNEAVVPVSPEAHALRLLSHLAPKLSRGLARIDLTPR